MKQSSSKIEWWNTIHKTDQSQDQEREDYPGFQVSKQRPIESEMVPIKVKKLGNNPTLVRNEIISPKNESSTQKSHINVESENNSSVTK